MAVFQNDPFPGTNYGQYLNWEKVTTPNGEILYVVPGYPAYVYDPVTSNASGRKVFRANPSATIKQRQEAEAAQKKAQKQAGYSSSPLGQAVPIVVGTGGALAANELMSNGIGKAPATFSALDPKTGNMIFSDGTIKSPTGQIISPPTTTSTASATSSAPITQGQAAAQGVSSNAQVIGQNADGSYIYAQNTNTLPPGSQVSQDGSILNAETGEVIGRVAQGALGLYQIYTGIQDFKNDRIGGGLGVASGSANVGAAMYGANSTAAAAAGPLMAAKGAWDVKNSWEHGGENIRGSAATLGAGIGTILLPGLGTIAGAGIGNAVGYGLDKLGLFHKTTKQREIDRWEDAGVKPEQYQQMIGHDYFEGTGGEKSREEKFLTPDAIRFNPDNYHNVPDWDSWNKSQQDTFLSTLLKENKVSERKGGIYYDDERAQELADQIRKGAITPAQAAAQGARSTTSSPGIGLNGLPIPIQKLNPILRR